MTPGRPLRWVAWLAALITAGLATSAPAAHAEGLGPPPVVLVAVPGLLWSDAAAMPSLAALAAGGAVGELSVKTAGATTRCGAGLLAVSAGNRTTSPSPGCDIDPTSWSALAERNHSSQYDATIGALGSALHRRGLKTYALTSAAIPMLADESGDVDRTTANLVDSTSDTGVFGVVLPGLYDTPAASRAAAARAVDDQIGLLRQRLPLYATLIVAGVSDSAAGDAQLHAIVINGPGWSHTQLQSSAAGRAPYVQLIDIAPTILTIERIKVPSSMVGQAMQGGGSAVPSIATYVDDNRHAVAQRTLGQRVFLALGLAAILLMLLIALPSEAARSAGRWLARLLAPAPVVVFIANAFPWWRWGQPAFAGFVMAGCLCGVAITTIAARRSVTAAIVAVPLISFVVLVIDQVTGAWLQLSAPLGDSPLVAGRFSGMGNLDFAVMATSAVIVAGVLGGRLSRVPAIAAATVIAAVAVVIDGAPGLGNDIGGVLSLLPGAIVVVALLARVHFTKVRVVAIAVTTIVIAVGVALADYSRPAGDQNDVGRFVGQVIHGGAATEVHRKLDAVFASIGLTIGTFVVAVAIVLVIVARSRIRLVFAGSPGVRAGVVAAAVVGILGAALNDSGITIAAMAIIVGLSAVYGSGVTASAPGRAATNAVRLPK